MRKLAILLLTTLLMAVSFAPNPAKAAADFNFAEEKTKLWEWLADNHADYGDSYADEKLFVDAAAEFGRALFLEAENRKAMRGLGYDFRGGEWVKDPDDALPEEDGVSGEEAVAAREKAERKLDRFIERAIDKLLELADECIEANQDASALICYHEVAYYDPNHARAQKARGYVEKDGIWIREVWRDFRSSADEMLEKASAGLEDTAEDEQAKKLNTTFYRHYSDYFSVRAQEGDRRAQRVHKVAVSARKLAQELLNDADAIPFAWEGDEERYGRTLNLLGLNNSETYLEFIEVFGPADEKQRDFQKKLAGGPMTGTYGYFWREGNSAFGDDVSANQIARRILHFYRPEDKKLRTAEWINAGFSYYVSARLLGTTITKYYTLSQGQSGGRTRAVRKKTGDEPENMRNPNLGPDDFRAIAKFEVMLAQDIPLPTLAGTPLNEMTELHAAKSFCFFEWLVENHSEAMQKWLAADIKDARGDLNKLAEEMGMAVGELDTAWRAWVLENY